jgi:hypothetical protein
MGAAECRKKVVKRKTIGQIGHGQLQRHSPPIAALKQVIGPERDIEEVSRFHAVGVVIIILGGRLRQRQKCGAAVSSTSPDRALESRKDAIAGKSDIYLLRRRQL